LRYLLAYGCKEGLVAELRDWPGAHCADSLVTGTACEGVWFDRRQEWLAWLRGDDPAPGAFATHHQLALALGVSADELLGLDERRQSVAKVSLKVARRMRMVEQFPPP
jgi:hypothetical protein